MELWIGTYPVAGQEMPTGRGEGIWRVGFDPDSGRLDAPRQILATPAPSFLAVGDRADVRYAVNEATVGTMTTLRQVGDDWRVAAITATGGAHPCHLMFDPLLRAVLVANYTSGSLALIEIDDDGIPRSDAPDQMTSFTGSGVNQVAHAHFILPTPDGDAILVTDLGCDVIRRFRRDVAGRRLLSDGLAAVLEPGSGPRHAVFSADASRLVVAEELAGRVSVLAWDGVSGRLLTVLPVSARSSPVAPSHVTLDGDRLLVGVRGVDVLAEFRLTGDGSVVRAREHWLPGSWPRHHAVIGQWVIVALQHGNRVAALNAGGEVVDAVTIPSPACVVAVGAC